MKRMTITEEAASRLKQGDPLEYHNGEEWVTVQVVRPLADDTVRIKYGTMEIDAVLGELRE